MHWVRFAILILATVVVQASLGDLIALGSTDVRPDFLLVVMVYLGVHGVPTDAVITSFVSGLARDVVGLTLGPEMLSFGVCGTLLSSVRRYVMIRSVPWQAITILISGAVTASLSRILSLVKGVPVPGDLLTQILYCPLYSAIIGPAIFIPLEWLMRMQDKRYRMGLR